MWSIFPRITLHFFYGRRLSPSATSVSVFICSNVERRKIRSYINSNTDLFRQSEVISSERQFDFLKFCNT